MKAVLYSIEGDGVMSTCGLGYLNSTSLPEILARLLSGVKIMTASPGDSLSIASLSAGVIRIPRSTVTQVMTYKLLR